MCSDYDLYICGDFKPPTYVNATMDDIQEYSEGLFLGKYVYKKDTVEEGYDYMSGSPLQGDCDDVVITLLEDLISVGYVDNGQAVWTFGVIDGERHAWLLITKEEETYVFDTYHLYGAPYDDVKHMYKEEFVVYRY